MKESQNGREQEGSVDWKHINVGTNRDQEVLGLKGVISFSILTSP